MLRLLHCLHMLQPWRLTECLQPLKPWWLKRHRLLWQQGVLPLLPLSLSLSRSEPSASRYARLLLIWLLLSCCSTVLALLLLLLLLDLLLLPLNCTCCRNTFQRSAHLLMPCHDFVANMGKTEEMRTIIPRCIHARNVHSENSCPDCCW
jgi:hypothetical protein